MELCSMGDIQRGAIVGGAENGGCGCTSNEKHRKLT
jgi:hypothetical protein